MGLGPGGFMEPRSPFKAQIQLSSFIGLVLLLVTACSSSSSRSNYYKENDSSRPLVDDKYRLTADREKFAEERSQEPAGKKIQNDEIAFVMQLMADPSVDPSSVREKFDKALSKKREIFQRDMEKERDEFTKTERQNREEFLKKADADRKDFLNAKHSRDQREEFFNGQDEKRKNYFENQHEKRNDFESDASERRKSFEDYAHQKRDEFTQEWRAFQKRHDEYEKNKKASTATGSAAPSQLAGKAENPEVKSFLQEFMNIPETPGTPLESGE